jgi:hypothetical protein
VTQWKDLGPAPAWTAFTDYVDGDTVLGVDVLDYVWAVLTAGQSDATEPAWDAGVGFMVDGSLTWALIVPWEAATDYGATDLVQPSTPNGHWYVCLGSGTSGSSEPTWPTDGSNIDDGGTGSDNGSLIPPDDTNNDTGTGGSAAGLSSHYIFQVWENPAIDRDAAPIGTLTEVSDREFRLVRNNCGEGKFTINRHSAQAAWLVQDRLVVVYRESIETAPVFAWLLETATEVAVSDNEDGGDLVVWSGRGSLALLDRVVLWNFSVLTNGLDVVALPQNDQDGMWHWVSKSAAAILVRQLEEAQARGVYYGSGVQDCAIPNVYWTFARHTDSVGDPYDEEGPYKLPVGDNMFSDVLPKLMQIGLLIRATPVINGDGHLRIRLDSWANDPGSSTGITFAKGVNILEAGEKVLEARQAGTDALVQGDIEQGSGPQPYVYRVRGDDTFRDQIGRREVFLPYQATPDSAMLDRAGDTLLANGRKRHNGPTTLQVLERTDEAALVDYIEWDYVTVDIPDVWDTYTDNLSEIILSENDIGVFDVGLQFSDSDPVGIVGIMIDPCACGQQGD